ncbi:MAG: 16S rRNA (guanine(527)-N(7))-methyltransferase RsmG [Gammaproteobacteria bacterium]|nr:16S rRNA (guanine(527)-N(7))-methyltransferase RsmG [Gammaproteobacteria bacterium]
MKTDEGGGARRTGSDESDWVHATRLLERGLEQLAEASAGHCSASPTLAAHQATAIGTSGSVATETALLTPNLCDGTTVTRLMVLLRLVATWNRVYNLTAVNDPEQMVIKHVLDSLSVLPWLAGRNWLDVGSGAGFPGLVLAIVQPSAHICCLDGNLKKSRFIALAARELDLANVRVERARLLELVRTESLDGARRADFDVVMSRAAMPAELLASQARDLLSAHGRVLAMLGRAAEVRPPAGFRVRVEPVHVPFLDAQRHVAVLVPDRYPADPSGGPMKGS